MIDSDKDLQQTTSLSCHKSSIGWRRQALMEKSTHELRAGVRLNANTINKAPLINLIRLMLPHFVA